jgi:hypothetical protein
MAHVLSKSSFIRGMQCIKSLYLYKHNYNLRDAISPSQQALFSRGINVGKIAQTNFPGGVDVTPESVFKYSASVEKTRKLIEGETTTIYEAAFIFNDVLAAIDILVKRNDQWFAYEVKSSTRVSDVYRLDASLQYYVIKNAGIELADFAILHLNNQYVRKGNIEPEKLFTTVSLLNECEKNQAFIADKVRELKEVSSFSAVPAIKIGKHCFEPYACDFMGQCWKNIPQNSVFELAGMSREKQFELFNNGFVKISELPAEYPLEKNQRIQVDATNTGKELIEKTEIAKFVSTIKYPVYFFDIETFMPVVPVFEGTSPFQHIPFQYSLHYKKTKDAPLEHIEFLAEAGLDPRKDFITHFLESTKDVACILVYNRTFESSVIARLGNDFPELKFEIEKRLSVMIDLMEPFQKRHYYHPMMKGSHSIKNVLPALYPDFNHKNLAISDGAMALAAFEQLQNETDLFKIAELRDNLLAYCKLDTLAMVKIFEFLEKI